MKQCTLVNGLREEDFMTLRWNADVHTVHRKTGEYRILNNQGTCLGEIVKESEEKYKIITYEEDMKNVLYKEIEKIKEISEKIISRQLDKPKIYKEKRKINFFPYIAHYQRNLLRNAA
ncbi:hypothetical protein A3K82_03160 [Candidatus Pacearchaeota archaeon RBG_19FT_COMBO_34_9]|nr:MAG: hypothetical protein A3K82_03160 [Candidatus Pacearchaeota archaeon RBG_19FT_COMBO_34_9]OGJ17053.1 MAG: hypothetical protein A3K74_01540 [Candidatus Pacearchaeota archaeon RBG_13_33_26]